MMRRHELIRLLGAAAATWPRVARAQQPVPPVVGFLGGASPESMAPRIAAFRQGLRRDRPCRGPERDGRLALGGAPAQPAAGTASDLATLAAKTATATIPIVFLSAGDPVRNSLVAGLDRPGGNVTGLSWFGFEVPRGLIAGASEAIR
jgi:putative ABC transport system substrate-binding protein